MFDAVIKAVSGWVGRVIGFNGECVSAFWEFNRTFAGAEKYSAVGAINLWWYSSGVPYVWEKYDRITSGYQYADWLIWSDTSGAYQNYDPVAGRGYGHVAMYSHASTRPGYAWFYSQNPGAFRLMELSLSGVVGALRLKTLKPLPSAPKLVNVKTSGACAVRTSASSISPETRTYPDGLNKGVTVSVFGYVVGQDPFRDGRKYWVKTKSGFFIWAGNIVNGVKGLTLLK